MQHSRIYTEQSTRDLRWASARTLADCDKYMAIEAQRAGAIGFAHVTNPANGFRGYRWFVGAQACVAEHYHYAREVMGLTDEDQLYA